MQGQGQGPSLQGPGQGQGQGPSLQGPGHGQGLDLQGQGQGLTSLYSTCQVKILWISL